MRIFVTTSFPGQHRYEDAPDEVAFLRTPHRHTFHVRAELEVFHDDRELEFLLCQRAINTFILGHFDFDLGTASCEQIAAQIAAFLIRSYGDREVKVEVSEDGENGAIVEKGGTLS